MSNNRPSSSHSNSAVGLPQSAREQSKAASQKRVLIVGGVAGGASCAARLRRLDESAEIVLFDRGPHVSFANCGLPYYVGNVIADERKLLMASPEQFRDRFAVAVHTGHEVTGIDRAAQTISVVDSSTGQTRVEPYDVLVLAPGAAPIRPSSPGSDLPGVFVVRTIPDTRRIRAWIDERLSSPKAGRVVVVGAGFIGLEMVENLLARGLQVAVLEKAPQVMAPLDPEMALPVAERLSAHGVELQLGDGLAKIEPGTDGRLRVVAESGKVLDTDLVILALGVRPETRLARDSGLTLGARGGIQVNDQMRTSDPHIWAVGDAVEVQDVVSGQDVILPLAGPANRQGRIAADAIASSWGRSQRASRFRGVQGTAVVGVLGLTVASTGASEKGLRRAGVTAFEKVYLHPGHHAGYYPGAKRIHLKLLFSVPEGRILGAQAVGEEGVDKRIDVIAMAIQFGGTVHDLAEAELSYSPQFGAAKDPVNLAGMLAQNVLSGDMPLASHGQDGQALMLDVREPSEFEAHHAEGFINIPLSQLRRRFGELPTDRDIHVLCAVGQRGYYATRFLRQHGFAARNLSGGLTTLEHIRRAVR